MRICIKSEKLSPAFKKHHLQGLPFAASINEFSAPDLGDPHDHPFDFITHILSGGYVERIFRINEVGEVNFEDVERKPGTIHFVKATDIHKIIDLPSSNCITLMIPQSGHVRSTCFYRFIDGKAHFRLWNKRKFKPYSLDNQHNPI